MSPTPSRNRSLFSSLAGLASAAGFFRPGSPSPASNAPYLAAPPPAAEHRRARRGSALRRSLTASVAEGIAAEVIVACAGSTALTGWALFLDAGPFLVGVLTSLPFLTQFVHLPAAWVTARAGRRRVALWAVAASRQAYLPLAALPFLPLSAAGKLAILLSVAAVSAALAVVGNNAWVAWMGDLVPPHLRGRYFGRRTAICTLGGTAASLLAGLVLDRAKLSAQTGTALAVLALVACVAGAATTWLMSLQHDPGGGGGPTPRLSDFARPLADPNARRILGYQISWNLAVGISGPFFAVFMLQDLEMGFALVALQAAGAAAVRVLVVPLWGRAIDRIGARPVLVACSFAIAGIPLIWLLPTPGHLWPVALDALATGVLWSGHGLASFALPLSVAPRQTRPFYLAAFSASSGLAFAAAAAFGGLLAERLPSDLVVAGHPIYGLQVLFVLSTLARLAAAIQVTRIAEPGAQPVSALLALVRDGAQRLALPRPARRALPPFGLGLGEAPAPAEPERAPPK